jgi:phenylacetate-CoA ligase
VARTYRYNLIVDAYSALVGKLIASVLHRRYASMTRREFEVESFRRLQKIVRHAYKNVDYYKDVLRATSIRNGRLESLEQFREIPVLTRDFVRKNHALLVDPSRRWFVERITTSGSAGSATPLRQSWNQIAFDFASIWWSFGFGGYRFRDGMATLRSYVPDVNQPLWAEDKLRGFYFMSAYHLDDRSLRHYVDMLAVRKLPYLRGYPHSLSELASYCLREGIRDISFKNVFTCSENLSKIQRERIEQAFSTRIIDRYGNIEMVAHATQCAHGGVYHVDPLYGYVEIVGDADVEVGVGESGRVIATGLHNFAMPLLRYEIGDIATRGDGQCICGLQTPTLQAVCGRVDDSLVKADGSAIPPVNFYTMFQKYPQFDGFKIIQGVDKAITVQIKAQQLSSEDREAVVKGMIARCGPGLSISVERVDVFELSAFGKFRNIRSHASRK